MSTDKAPCFADHLKDGRAADPPSWGVYVKGVDEWIAAPSQEAAEAHAHALNAKWIARSDRSENDPRLWAIPDLWPFTSEDV